MRYKALALIVSCLLFSSVALTQAKESAEKKAPAKAAAKAPAGAPDVALMKQIAEAWSSMDPENAAKYYDKTPTDVFFDAAPLKYTGWDDYLKGSKAFFSTLKSLKFMVNDDAAVHHMGNFAYGTATAHMEMTDKSDKTQSLDTRWTLVWEKKGANWLVVHEHFSVPMEMPK